MIKMLRVNRNLVDVFLGDGWTNWARFGVFRRDGKIEVKKVSGGKMPASVIKSVYGEVTK